MGGAAKERERVLGRYVLLQRLGSGGFGEVWRAHDEMLGREVAVKRIAGGEADRSAREAQAAARLSHPAIVALYEAAFEDGAFYLTSELVEGATLAELIAEDALADEEIFEIGLALCDALRHAHSRGVIHRDVKPQNILIPDDPADRGPAKLTDFGGARLDGEQALTATGDVLGTFAYMAPEQSEGRVAGPQADLYSLALVLYEALTGENPVRAATPAATVRRIGGRLPPLRRMRRDVPKRLAFAIDLALDPDPARRGSLDQLAHALAAVLPEGQPPDESLPDRPPPHRTMQRAVEPPLAAPIEPPSRAMGEPPQRGLREPPWDPRESSREASRENPHIPESSQAGSPASSKLALPKIAWTIAALALAVSQLASGRAGLALLLLAGALPLLLAMPRKAGFSWLAVALCPALGLAGLACAYPAIAARPASPRLRAALGAVGFWWLCLAQLPLGRLLSPAVALLGLKGVSGRPVGGVALAPAAAWEGSLTSAAHALAPLIGVPSLACAALWALGALLLPALLRGVSPFVDVAIATAWSVAMLVGPPLLVLALGGDRLTLATGLSRAVPAATGAPLTVLGAVLGALLAVGAVALRASPAREEPYRGSAHRGSHP